MIPQNQRSEAWRKWRRDKVTATDATSIMGCGFKSIGELFDEKLGIRPPEEENDDMRRGNALEDEARNMFELESGYMVFPQVCVSSEYSWMTASLDGLTIEKDVAVEIKCPGVRAAAATFHSRKIPDYYIPQLQHQMFVTGLNEIYYYSYAPEDFTCLLMCFRDDAYIKKMIEKEEKFYEILLKALSKIESHHLDLDNLKAEAYKILEEN